MDSLRQFVKQKRKELKLTQEDLALNAGVGLRFVRDLEQGKKTLRLDKVNDVLALFGKEVRQKAQIKQNHIQSIRNAKEFYRVTETQRIPSIKF